MDMEELLGLLLEATGRTVAPDDELLESGILDSLGMLVLLEALEDRGYALHPASLPHAAFSSARSIHNQLKRSKTR